MSNWFSPFEWLKYCRADNREWGYKSLFMSICMSRMHNNHDNNSNDMQCTIPSLLPHFRFNIFHSICTQWWEYIRLMSRDVVCESLKISKHVTLDGNSIAWLFCMLKCWNMKLHKLYYGSSHNFQQWHSIYAQFHAESCMHKCCVFSPLSHSTKQSITWRE